ncbi:hypothetical protein [Moritella sp. F3]|uniref:hypothetical protein n=1 Tax=Moritella sp. F3 TaxID=2718882 RepID=UPI0018E0C626|nr:hypothetical protein [Moritella sp. F3]GIC77702.1 hypothetical protein FMO001_24290 [Moritella sp. F1]GIC82115.1 hypothetical protein FMO003_23960 [Moritella sp. F3]
MARTLKYNMKIRQNGDTWCIHGIGISKENKTWCHLVSTTRFRKQRNGDCPIQIQTWVKGLPLNPEYLGESNA